MAGLQRIHNYFSTDPEEFARQVQEFERSVQEALTRVEESLIERPNIIVRLVPGPSYVTNDVIEFEVTEEGFGISSDGLKLEVSRSGMYQVNIHAAYNHVGGFADGFAAVRVHVNGAVRCMAVHRLQDPPMSSNRHAQGSALIRIEAGDAVNFQAKSDPGNVATQVFLTDTQDRVPRISLVWVAE